MDLSSSKPSTIRCPMGFFNVFRDKGKIGFRDLKKMHDNLDLRGLLVSIPKVEREYLPHLLEFIGSIATEKPHIVRSMEREVFRPIVSVPVEKDHLLIDRWTALCLILSDMGYFDKLVDAGLAKTIRSIIPIDEMKDWKFYYLINEICSRPSGRILSDTDSIAFFLKSLEKSGDVNIPYILSALDRLSSSYGYETMTQLGAIDKFRNLTIHQDPAVSQMARNLMGKCEIETSRLAKTGSILVSQVAVLTAQEEAPAGKKEDTAEGSGYYRPGRGKTPRKGASIAVSDDRVEDLSKKKRKVDHRFKAELEEVLRKEADGIYSNEEFEIEE